MSERELRIQASLWNGRGQRTAALVMEGAARDRLAGGIAVDALHRIALGRGLRLTTDLDRPDPRPVRGWRVRIDRIHSVTVEWPHIHPLLDRVPLDLPAGWLRTACGAGEIVLLVGYGLGLGGSAGDGAELMPRLEHAAREGALAGGTVPVLTADPDATEIPTQATVSDRLAGNSGEREELLAGAGILAQ